MFPLIKTVARVSESSTLAHNMQMSFNTALRTVHGPVIRYGHFNRLSSEMCCCYKCVLHSICFCGFVSIDTN